MKDSPSKIIDKVIWSVLGTVGIVLVKFIGDLNQTNRDLMIQLSRITMQLEYHDSQLVALRQNNENLFRIETELGMHEKRLALLERKLK
jgi:hypothetical protein